MTSAPSSLSGSEAARRAFLAACFRFTAGLGADCDAGVSALRALFLHSHTSASLGAPSAGTASQQAAGALVYKGMHCYPH